MNDRNFLLQDTEYEGLDSIPVTRIVSSKFLTSLVDENDETDTKTSETEIIFALGFIITLVMSSFFLLYLCLKATPANLNTKKSKLSTAFIDRGWDEKNELQYGFQASKHLDRG